MPSGSPKVNFLGICLYFIINNVLLCEGSLQILHLHSGTWDFAFRVSLELSFHSLVALHLIIFQW